MDGGTVLFVVLVVVAQLTVGSVAFAQAPLE